MFVVKSCFTVTDRPSARLNRDLIKLFRQCDWNKEVKFDYLFASASGSAWTDSSGNFAMIYSKMYSCRVECFLPNHLEFNTTYRIFYISHQFIPIMECLL